MSSEFLLIDGDDDQEISDIVRLKNGNLAITWYDGSIDSDFFGNGIGLTVLDRNLNQLSAGTPYTRFEGDQFGGYIAPTATGFVIGWMSDDVDNAGNDDPYIDSYIRYYNADGTAQSGVIQVTPSGVTRHCRIQDLVVLPDGTVHVLTAESDVRTDWDLPVYRFDANGNRLGPRVMLQDDIDTGLAQAGYLRTPQAELTVSGNGYLLTYSEYYGDGQFGAGIYSQRFNGSGAALTQPTHFGKFPPAQYHWIENDGPVVRRNPDGTFATTWWAEDRETDIGTLYYRTLDSAGRPLGAPVIITSDSGFRRYDMVTIEELGGGYNMIVYTERRELDTVDDYFMIEARIIGPDGRPLGASFNLLDKAYLDITSMGIETLATGEMLLTWSWGDSTDKDTWAKFIGDGTDAVPRVLQAKPGVALTGTAGIDLMLGTAQADQMRGGNGNDIITGAAGNDKLFGNTGNDRIFGDDGNDYVIAAAGNDQAMGGNGNDILYGLTGNDQLNGGAGADRVFGGAGTDILVGQAGNDALYGEAGNDQLNGGTGDDRLNGGDQNDRLLGETGRDSLIGGAGNDLLLGMGDDDLMIGQAGGDTLAGQTGDDILTGEGGVDTFIFERGYDYDRITDFTAADKLQLDADLWTGTLTANQVIARFARDTGSSVTLDFGDGDVLRLLGMDSVSELQGHILIA